MLTNRRKISAVIMAFIMISASPRAFASTIYKVASGDSLWTIANKYKVTVQSIKDANKLSNSTIYVGQTLVIPSITASQGKYTVKSGDTLWLIAKSYNVSVNAIKTANKLTSDLIYAGQTLIIPSSSSSLRPGEGASWGNLQSYIVQAGDTAYLISKKFGVTEADVLKYNYMTVNDWFTEGQKIAINGYAPRQYAVVPGMDASRKPYGHLVDWFLDGQYYLKRNTVFQITDYKTGLNFTVKVLGGYNHCDIEPITAADTATMKRLFPAWNWTPRPVVVYYNGMNMAASLSGMPHSFDTTPDNGVSGHFDLYLLNSKPHNGETSQTYVGQHAANVRISAQSK